MVKQYFKILKKFNPKIGHRTPEDREGEASLNLDELMQLFTVGNSTLVQKSALLCKFHRGLDTSTLIDRFNFEAWQQLVNCFGTENYKKWDGIHCPCCNSHLRTRPKSSSGRHQLLLIRQSKK